MRQIISTAVVAVVVGAVAGATMGAVAQSGPDATAQQAIVPAVTSINAHKVDGRHAVSASASRKKRAGKLVATNRRGYLPSNIIKPAWHLMQGTPPGFADGVDDVGVAGIKVITVTDPTPGSAVTGGGDAGSFAECPAGSKVVGGGHSTNSTGQAGLTLVYSFPSGNGWSVGGKNWHSTGTMSVTAYALCLSADPASTISAANKGFKPSGRRGK